MAVVSFRKQDAGIEAFLMSINSPWSYRKRRWYDNLIFESTRDRKNKEEKDLRIAYFPTASFFPDSQSAHVSDAEKYFSIYDAEFTAIDTSWCFFFFRNDFIKKSLDNFNDYLAPHQETVDKDTEIKKFYEYEQKLRDLIGKDSLLEKNVLNVLNNPCLDGFFDLEKLSSAISFFNDYSQKAEQPFLEKFNRNVSEISEADIIYVGGGSPEVLMHFFLMQPKNSTGTLWHAIEEALLNGAVYAGNSAGAMIVCEEFYKDGDLESDAEKTEVAPAFGLVRIGGCIPHYEGRKYEQVRILSENTKEPVYSLPNDSLIHAVVSNGETINTFHGTKKPFCIWENKIFECATVMH